MASTQVFHNQGCDLNVDVFRGALAVPSTLWILLRTLDGVSGHPTDAGSTDSLSSNLAEASGGGYARISIAFDSAHWTKSQSGNITLLTAVQQAFNFTGNVTGITHYAIATSADNSGKLIMSAPMGNIFNPTSGTVINVTPTMGFLTKAN